MKEYSAAEITFLNREEETEKIAMMYPITRIVLKYIDMGVPASGAVKTQKVFIVKDGKWEEECQT